MDIGSTGGECYSVHVCHAFDLEFVFKGIGALLCIHKGGARLACGLFSTDGPGSLGYCSQDTVYIHKTLHYFFNLKQMEEPSVANQGNVCQGLQSNHFMGRNDSHPLCASSFNVSPPPPPPTHLDLIFFPLEKVKNPEAVAAAAAAAAAAGAGGAAPGAVGGAPDSHMTLTKVVYRLKKWKYLLECRVFRAPSEIPLQRCSPYLAQVW